MSVKADIKLYVGGRPNLVTKIGDRFYPVTLPQEPTLPAVTYLIVSGDRAFAHSGDLGFVTFRVQFDSYALTPGEAEEVVDLVVTALTDWSNPNYAAFPFSPQDFPEPELSRFRMTVDAMISHKE